MSGSELAEVKRIVRSHLRHMGPTTVSRLAAAVYGQCCDKEAIKSVLHKEFGGSFTHWLREAMANEVCLTDHGRGHVEVSVNAENVRARLGPGPSDPSLPQALPARTPPTRTAHAVISEGAQSRDTVPQSLAAPQTVRLGSGIGREVAAIATTSGAGGSSGAGSSSRGGQQRLQHAPLPLVNLVPKSLAQESYLRALRDTSVHTTLCFGSHGTGKTSVAVVAGLQWLQQVSLFPTAKQPAPFTDCHFCCHVQAPRSARLILCRPGQRKERDETSAEYRVGMNRPALDCIDKFAYSGERTARLRIEPELTTHHIALPRSLTQNCSICATRLGVGKGWRQLEDSGILEVRGR